MNFKELKQRALKDEKFKKEWDKSSPFWQLQAQLIEARINSKLTQNEIAQKMQVAQSAVARFEKAQNSNINTIISYARAVGLKKLIISL